MIKATGETKTGEPFLLLGLSGENVTRLTAGEPVNVSADDMAEMGLPRMQVVIHYGRTEQAIVDEFRRYGVDAPLRGAVPPGLRG